MAIIVEWYVKNEARASSRVPNTEKKMKARGIRRSAFIVSRCLEPVIKYEARVFDIKWNNKKSWSPMFSQMK